MAKIEIIIEADNSSPRSVECVEVLVWGVGGSATQEFSIGSGGNFNATGNMWLEIRYSVQDIPVFYTRNVVHLFDPNDMPGLENALEKFANGEFDTYGFGGNHMFALPATGIFLKRKKFTDTGIDGETHTYSYYVLSISPDMGAVFGHQSPGERMLEIRLDPVGEDQGMQFMRDFIQEIIAASKGCHPDPGSFPFGYSEYPFARELNRRAYNQLATEYQEDYFANPLLADAFDGWLAQLPAGGQILDAGCGHGDPVINRMQDRGFQVTGSDLSPEMLRRAREQFPNVEFWERAITEINTESAFDGACSFSSMLYLDPIDFFHGIHRLHQALKPGGLLFLFAYDLHPTWRGQPYHVDIKHWMWGGTRGMDETARDLEEHGYFEVVKTIETWTEDDRKKGVEEWRVQAQKENEEWIRSLPPEANVEPTDFSNVQPRIGYPYVVIARKLAR